MACSSECTDRYAQIVLARDAILRNRGFGTIIIDISRIVIFQWRAHVKAQHHPACLRSRLICGRRESP